MPHYPAIEELHGATVGRLKHIVNGLTDLLDSDCSERIRLLGRAFLEQLKALSTTVENIGARQSSRALRRKVRIPELPQAFDGLPAGADSLALTFWVLAQLKLEADCYRALEGAGRLGPAQGAVTELAALFTAQSKRIAVEAHRFSDL